MARFRIQAFEPQVANSISNQRKLPLTSPFDRGSLLSLKVSAGRYEPAYCFRVADTRLQDVCAAQLCRTVVVGVGLSVFEKDKTVLSPN